MSLQSDLLPELVEVCSSFDAGCAVVLIGSVARGTERPNSDIDLNVIFPGDAAPIGVGPYIADDNRWQLQVKDVIRGVRIDVAWETRDRLVQRLSSDTAAQCWPFSRGRILHDPCAIAAPCLELTQAWFAQHPEINQRYEAEYAAAKNKPQG